MQITIGASRNNKLGSKLIRWWIGAPYSHVFVKWHLITQNRDIVYQASHGMVHFIAYDNFLKDNEIVEEIVIDIDNEHFIKFSKKCIDLAGQPYSTNQLIQIFLYDISNQTLHFNDLKGYICSELICELLSDIGYTFNKVKYLINPKDIINTLMGNK